MDDGLEAPRSRGMAEKIDSMVGKKKKIFLCESVISIFLFLTNSFHVSCSVEYISEGSSLQNNKSILPAWMKDIVQLLG